MGKAAKGTLLKLGDGGATESFTTIFEVRDIDWGGETMDLEETTYQTSSMEENVATVIRAGELTAQVNSNPRHATLSTAGVLGDLRSGTLRNIELVMPAATSTAADVLTLAGHITGVSGPTAAVTGALVREITFKPHTTLPSWSTRGSVS